MIIAADKKQVQEAKEKFKKQMFDKFYKDKKEDYKFIEKEFENFLKSISIL